MFSGVPPIGATRTLLVVVTRVVGYPVVTALPAAAPQTGLARTARKNPQRWQDPLLIRLCRPLCESKPGKPQIASLGARRRQSFFPRRSFGLVVGQLLCPHPPQLTGMDLEVTPVSPLQ
jgi:hypothetical protein